MQDNYGLKHMTYVTIEASRGDLYRTMTDPEVSDVAMDAVSVVLI